MHPAGSSLAAALAALAGTASAQDAVRYHVVVRAVIS
jgi:hypothetical protein